MKTEINSYALHRREYKFGSVPNSGWRFLAEGEVIRSQDFAYHVTDSTYIPCRQSVGRKVDKHDAGNTYIRLETIDDTREEELQDYLAREAARLPHERRMPLLKQVDVLKQALRDIEILHSYDGSEPVGAEATLALARSRAKAALGRIEGRF